MRVSFLAVACAAVSSAVSAQLDLCFPARETILDTSFTQVIPCGAPPINVSGGVFVFRDITINAGQIVRGIGPNPLVFIATRNMRIDGTLSVDGGDGDQVNTLASANFPTPGGIGACTGGNGGQGSPVFTDRSFLGQAGFGAFQVPGLGGRGGRLSCLPPFGSGSGGGGGGFATIGDAFYLSADGDPVLQALGFGGYGSGGVPGGAPGASPFADGRPENDFIGVSWDLNRRVVIQGELTMLRGGQGGGGGGDRALQCTTNDPLFINDAKGGGGGAGGGAVLVLAFNDLTIGPQGRVSADGGDGGGGEQAGSNNQGGGGAGGSGGLVVLAAGNRIALHAHGETYANGDYDFAITADGGIGAQGNFAGVGISSKYPPAPTAAYASSAGGFGGMGIVQLFARPGNNVDGTNTILDDSIDVYRNGVPLLGTEKQRYLGWRGWPDRFGNWVDDAGQATANEGREGDVRPAPVLLPLF